MLKDLENEMRFYAKKAPKKIMRVIELLYQILRLEAKEYSIITKST